MAQLKEVRPVLTGVSVEEVSVEEGSAGEETEDSIFHGKKEKKTDGGKASRFLFPQNRKQ